MQISPKAIDLKLLLTKCFWGLSTLSTWFILPALFIGGNNRRLLLPSKSDQPGNESPPGPSGTYNNKHHQTFYEEQYIWYKSVGGLLSKPYLSRGKCKDPHNIIYLIRGHLWYILPCVLCRGLLVPEQTQWPLNLALQCSAATCSENLFLPSLAMNCVSKSRGPN